MSTHANGRVPTAMTAQYPPDHNGPPLSLQFSPMCHAGFHGACQNTGTVGAVGQHGGRARQVQGGARLNTNDRKGQDGQGRLVTLTQLLVAVAALITLGLNLYYSNRAASAVDRAQQLNEEQLRAAQRHAQLYPGLPNLTVLSQDETKIVLTLDADLQNIGNDTARGCLTEWEPASDDNTLNPQVYWPSIFEPAGLTWSLDSGQTHNTVAQITLPRSDFAYYHLSTTLIETWFSCQEPQMTSTSKFFRLNLSASTMAYTPTQRTKMLSDWDRAGIVNAHRHP